MNIRRAGAALIAGIAILSLTGCVTAFPLKPSRSHPASSYSVASTFAMKEDSARAAVADVEARRMYVINEYPAGADEDDDSTAGSIAVIDQVKKKTITSISLDFVPYAITINQKTHTIFVTGDAAEGGKTEVSAIDGRTNTVTSTLEVPGLANAAAIDPETGAVWLVGQKKSGRSDGILQVLDPTARKILVQKNLGEAFIGIAIDVPLHTAYITDMYGRKIWMVDTKTRQVNDSFSVPNNPNRIVVDNSRGEIYVGAHTYSDDGVSSDGGDELFVIDLNSGGTILKKITLPGHPYALAIDPARSSLFVVADGEDSGGIVVIDTIDRTIADTVPGPSSWSGVAVDRANGTAFAIDGESSDVSIITPGSGTASES